MVRSYSAVTELNEHQMYMAQMKSSDGDVHGTNEVFGWFC